MMDTISVAEKLLGHYLVRHLGSSTLVGRIVETEAYLGLKDPCCHSFQGVRTDRTEAMYLLGGHSYVYFIYGMYYCFNVVTQSEKEPEAVLIRALEPLKGISKMKENRKKEKLTDLCSGPGKLCQAFKINKALNAYPLTQFSEFLQGSTDFNYELKNQSHSEDMGEIYIAWGKNIVKDSIEVDQRVGLPFYEDSAYWPLRFYLKDSPFVSVKAVR